MMIAVKNLKQKRVGDMSHDKKVFQINIKGYITRISANPDGTLKIKQEKPK